MKKRFVPFITIYFAFTISLISCKSAYETKSVTYKDYKLNSDQAQNSSLNNMLKPYADSVNSSMSGVVAIAGMMLEKKQPEGTLGNVLVDAMLNMAKQKYNVAVDIALLNNGGVRLPSVSPGNITKGKIFEMAPFDNTILLLKINGNILQSLLDHVASLGGWPSAGMTWQIKNKKAVNILINGLPINESSTYTLATNDYLANGGDNCDMLRNIPQQNNNYIYRDLIVEYFTQLNKEGKTITTSIQNRVSYAK